MYCSKQAEIQTGQYSLKHGIVGRDQNMRHGI